LKGNDRMRGYISVINDLTISEENRLRSQVERLTVETEKIDRQARELQRLREEFEHYKEENRKQTKIDMEGLDDFEARNKAKLKKEHGVDFEFEWVDKKTTDSYEAEEKAWLKARGRATPTKSCSKENIRVEFVPD
jgi:hypothetical protein